MAVPVATTAAARADHDAVGTTILLPSSALSAGCAPERAMTHPFVRPKGATPGRWPDAVRLRSPGMNHATVLFLLHKKNGTVLSAYKAFLELDVPQ